MNPNLKQHQHIQQIEIVHLDPFELNVSTFDTIGSKLEHIV